VHTLDLVVIGAEWGYGRRSGGVALRFARVLRYRPDKTPAEADTIEAVRALLAGAADQAGGVPGAGAVPSSVPLTP
jgi:ATP-dependent DNA ligase